MAPMTRQHSPGGVPDAENAAYYRRRAENDCGLIITEGTTIDDPVAGVYPTVPHFHGREALAGWKRVVDGVHEAGGKIMPQLWHAGMARDPAKSEFPDLPSASPSGHPGPDKGFFPAGARGEPMSKAHIQRVIDGFARAASDARALGFDGIELHGAHGYIIDQFFWDGMNQRDDEYGGDLVGRTRFAVDMIKAVRREVGSDYPLSFRFSQWKQQDFTARLAQTPDELARFLKPLADAGVDIFHCSTRRFWEPEFEGSDLNLAGWTKKLTGKPTITVGSVGLSGEFLAAYSGETSQVANLDGLLERLAGGEFDLVAVGRSVLGDHTWARKLREERFNELQPFKPESLKEYY
jgi:2,4-dienoyl-CoA reductase-like NADH-dependent reductase (Old Yellow Enzyme family)